MKISTIWAWNRWLALSDVLAFNGNNVLVYARDTDCAKEINEHHTSHKYLWDKVIDKKFKNINYIPIDLNLVKPILNNIKKY